MDKQNFGKITGRVVKNGFLIDIGEPSRWESQFSDFKFTTHAEAYKGFMVRHNGKYIMENLAIPEDKALVSGDRIYVQRIFPYALHLFNLDYAVEISCQYARMRLNAMIDDRCKKAQWELEMKINQRKNTK